jgi:hypothetical protein
VVAVRAVSLGRAGAGIRNIARRMNVTYSVRTLLEWLVSRTYDLKETKG